VAVVLMFSAIEGSTGGYIESDGIFRRKNKARKSEGTDADDDDDDDGELVEREQSRRCRSSRGDYGQMMLTAK
jgi:hypothetical protein